MSKTGIIFPHQLYEQNILVSTCKTIFLVEEFLYFKQYNFHKQKIVFHRAAMKYYESFLKSKGVKVKYVEANDKIADVRSLITYFKTKGIEHFEYVDTTDYWLEQRIKTTSEAQQIYFIKHPTQLFLNSTEDNAAYFQGNKKMFQTDYYRHQRQKRNILLEKPNKPLGGKWSFDDENRLRYPKGKIPPKVKTLPLNAFYAEAIKYTEKHFHGNYGTVNSKFSFPCTHDEGKQWLHNFFETRFAEFGAFEDAIVANENVLHHGVLTPVMNVGLLSPKFIVEETLSYASNHEVPLNSVEGFIRQIIGWREFMRAVYELKGREERTRNYWGFHRKIPPAFWNGTTGIVPIDITIKKVLETGYCHHIERLMVLGNFMLLCEFDPDEVYQWFMTLFIDAYDWVMVPNVYGMSQFADGGLMSTKPYISGSNYLMKMSDYEKGDWQKIWDGLFWRFMHTQRKFFLQNPRLGMLVNSFDKMSTQKQKDHLDNAEKFLAAL